MGHQVTFEDLKGFVSTTQIAYSSSDKKSLQMRAWTTSGIIFWVVKDGRIVHEGSDLQEAIKQYNEK